MKVRKRKERREGGRMKVGARDRKGKRRGKYEEKKRGMRREKE